MPLHMFEHTVSITAYLTYAALTIGLIVCSVLSPIRTVTVGSQQLRLYGVALSFQLPPPDWNADSALASGSDIASSSSSSSSLDSGSRSSASSYGSDEALSISSDDGISSAVQRVSPAPFVFGDLSFGAEEVAAINNKAKNAGLSSSPMPLPLIKAQSVQELRNEMRASALVDPLSAMSLFSGASLADNVVFDSASSSSSDSHLANGNRTQWVRLRNIPSSDLSRCMRAYLAFAILCIFFSLLLMLSLFAQLMPSGLEMSLRIAIRVFAVAGPLCAILCFAMAASLGLQGKLVRHVADGYYANNAQHKIMSRLNSGFFTTVAAAFISLVVVLLSPVFWKR